MDEQRVVEAFNKLNPKLIRNVCIIAHVDHGKTTLADFLLSSNGIISARLAGKLRFMDSREDEQQRGITMKTSVISLFFDPLLINLMDSPGHVDFISEVNSAVNIADIALLVVDVVEGVCSQTEALLRQAVLNQVQVLLVINKMDRLILELKMTEAEAFRHLSRLIENVNSTLSQILQGQLFEEEDVSKFEAMEQRFHFNPVFGNVIFASAAHGYAFTLADFARLWSPRLKLDEKTLSENLFSDSYLSGTKIQPNADSKGRRSLFEQLVLNPLWEVQKAALIDNDLDKLKAFATKINLPAVKSKQMSDAFPEFMRAWLPLSTTVIRSIAQCMSAQDAFKSAERLPVIFSANDCEPLTNAVRACDSNDTLCSVFVVKLFRIEDRKVALVRVMSGTLRKGQKLYAPSSKDNVDSQEVVVESVNVMLGREVVNVEVAPAGTVVAIQISDWVQNTTLLSQPLRTQGLNFDSAGLEPLVRVTVRPTSSGVTEMQELRQALKQLAILDSAVRVFEQEDGDLALVTAGEVHLQKCIVDLSDMGQTELEISEPIVPLLETVVTDPQLSYAKIIATQLTECNLKSHNMRLKVRAVPLSDEVTKFLQENESKLKSFRESRFDDTAWLQTFHDQLIEKAKKSLVGLKGSWWQRKNEADVEKIFEHVWTFGPYKAKFNILFNAIPDYDRPSVWKATTKGLRALDRAVIAGFDIAVAQGILCEEPCQGVGIVLEEWDLGEPNEDAENTPDLHQDVQLQGQLISAAKQTFRAALRKQPLRLVAPMYHCKVSTTSSMLGKVHNVLSQRRAKAINEDVNEVNGLFEIHAYMPVAESFSFCEQLRKKTSGAASAQLEFSHWQVIDEDPFWQPTTEEELEEFGVLGDSVNQARAYMNAVRKRKGLQTDEVLVVSAEKQRNLKRNK